MRPGYERWVTRDYGSEGKALNLSKSRLGLFTYHLLRLGGEITSTWTTSAAYDRAYVQFAVSLPEGRKAELEEVTGIVLEKPPEISFGNRGWR